MRRIIDRAYRTSHDVLSTHKSSLDRVARRLLEKETLDGVEVNEILREETGVDYLKSKEVLPLEGPGEPITIAPGTGDNADVPVAG